tara:strand:+ start:576 stop:956 length:381 start_codon:yes stop_codon:yes gene_type:complete
MAIQANATLVSAAQKMGQALVPADTSKMFKEQFEALGKMHEAKASMITGAITSGLDVLQTGIDNKKAKKAELAKQKAELAAKQKAELAKQKARNVVTNMGKDGSGVVTDEDEIFDQVEKTGDDEIG